MTDCPNDETEATIIDRSDTGKRLLCTFVFVVIARLIEGVLAFVVLYQLLYTLVTQQPPKGRVTRFANRLLRYALEIGQYVTWNKPEMPFPFNDFPVVADDLNPAATP
jgi:hypothetical protein